MYATVKRSGRNMRDVHIYQYPCTINRSTGLVTITSEGVETDSCLSLNSLPMITTTGNKLTNGNNSVAGKTAFIRVRAHSPHRHDDHSICCCDPNDWYKWLYLSFGIPNLVLYQNVWLKRRNVWLWIGLRYWVNFDTEETLFWYVLFTEHKNSRIGKWSIRRHTLSPHFSHFCPPSRTLDSSSSIPFLAHLFSSLDSFSSSSTPRSSQFMATFPPERR